MNFKMFFGNVVQRFRSEVERIGKIMGSGWAHLSGRIKSCYLSLQHNRRKCRSRIREFISCSRKNLVERFAHLCARLIDFRNDIRLRLDEISQSRLIKIQTGRPVQIHADVQEEASWMFFKTTHPVITTDHLTFNGSRMQVKKQTPLVRALFEIPGVAEVALMRYKVRVTRGSLFSAKDLMPKIMEVLREHLA